MEWAPKLAIGPLVIKALGDVQGVWIRFDDRPDTRKSGHLEMMS